MYRAVPHVQDLYSEEALDTKLHPETGRRGGSVGEGAAFHARMLKASTLVWRSTLSVAYVSRLFMPVHWLPRHSVVVALVAFLHS